MSNIPYQNKTEQDQFLKYLVEQNIAVFIFLKNGLRLRGFIHGFDNHTIFLRPTLEKQYFSQMIYKHAISTISGDDLSPGYIASSKIARKGY